MAEPDTPAAISRVFETKVEVRSYELDAFNHANHAVFLNWFEYARFEAMAAGGFPIDDIAARGWAVVVVRAEVDFRKEARLGDVLLLRTWIEEVRNTSMVLVQRAVRAGSGDAGDGGETVVAEARIVGVWLDRGRPMRIPPEVLRALGIEG